MLFDTVTYLHKWCQVIIGLENGLASDPFQATTWTHAELLPVEPREKSSDTVGLTLVAETKWSPFSRRHFPMHFLNENVQISTNISLNFVP